jgi:hypothetical protein
MPTDTSPDTRITRDDLEQGLRSMVGEVEHQAQAQARKFAPVAIGGALLVLYVAYRIGKRVGTTKSTVVEIRRI